MTDNNKTDFSSITTILFDMDGTLIRHTWQLEQLTQAHFAHFVNELVPMTHDEFYTTFWTKSEDMWHMMVDGVLDGETAAKYSYIHTLRTLERDTGLAEPMLAYWRRLVLMEATPFTDTFEVLEALRGRYTTGILTNGFTFLQRSKIDHHNLDDYVDFSLVSEEAGHHKPDRRVFEKALHMAGSPDPGHTLYVGDSMEADIHGAQQAGLVPILMNPVDDLEPPDKVVKIRQLSQLLTLLKEPTGPRAAP